MGNPHPSFAENSHHTLQRHLGGLSEAINFDSRFVCVTYSVEIALENVRRISRRLWSYVSYHDRISFCVAPRVVWMFYDLPNVTVQMLQGQSSFSLRD